jgi:hypothetical protein
MERLLEWFARLDRKYQVALVTNDEEGKREMATLVLTQMAGLDKVGNPYDLLSTTDTKKAVAAIRTLLDQVERLSRTQQENLDTAKKAVARLSDRKGGGGSGKSD